MKFGNMILAVLSMALAAVSFPVTGTAAGGADAPAIQYHFAGAADLARNTNFDRAKRILTLPPAKRFQDVVVDRWAGVFGRALQFDPAGNCASLRPILNDLLQVESVGSFGGHDKDRMNFVLAARLDANSAAAWQKGLETALHSPGETLTVEGFSGRRWPLPGSHYFWMVQARDWVVVGRGEDLLPIRTEYLQHIQQSNRPAPSGKGGWLDVDIDWPLLAAWVPLSDCPFKLARTKVNVGMETGRMRATATVTYPEAVAWKSEPWRIPKELVSNPLSSFTASQNVGAFLKPSATSVHLSSNPLTDQLFCWASREMALLNFAAWPVPDATNALRAIGTQAPPILNPFLEARDRTQLKWDAKNDQLLWTGMQLTGPTLKAAHDKSGDFLLARLFPMDRASAPAPEQLWSQFQSRNDLVYYDWEMTGLRVMQWRLLSEMLPVIPAAAHEKAPKTATIMTPLMVTEDWLRELSIPALDNTVTEVTRSSPTELTVIRNSPFLCTGLELVLLSHWLADAPVGPVDYTLLPQAKMSGPGMPRPH